MNTEIQELFLAACPPSFSQRGPDEVNICSPLGKLPEFLNARCNLRFLAGFGANKDFLQALGGLRNGLQSSRDRPLNPDRPGPAASCEGFTTVGVSDDHSHHPVHGLDPPNQDTALLGGALMASA